MSLIRSFKYAFYGLFTTILYERNMRIHFVVMMYVLVFSKYYDFSKTQYGVLFALFALVMGAELFNTSIEKLCDRVTKERDSEIKAVKDIAAGAVLICAVFAAVVGIIMFADGEIIKEPAYDISHSAVKLISFVLSIVLAVLFIKFGLIKKK